MKSEVDLSHLPAIENPGRIVILKSKWYPEYVESMAGAARRVLEHQGYTRIEEHTLPGSLEIPLAARDLLATDTACEIDALICFGIIVKGDTLHFEMISYECMRGLGRLMEEFRRPIIVEVIPVFDIQHAAERAADDEFNKGIEAGVAAIEMVAWRRSVT